VRTAAGVVSDLMQAQPVCRPVMAIWGSILERTPLARSVLLCCNGWVAQRDSAVVFIWRGAISESDDRADWQTHEEQPTRRSLLRGIHSDLTHH
jgi:hypothetical protein